MDSDDTILCDVRKQKKKKERVITIEVRKANMEDAKRVNWLLTLLIRDEKQYNPEIDETFEVTDMYENYMEDPKRRILVVEEEHQIVGYLYGYLKDGDEIDQKQVAKLDAVYVDVDYRQRGMASALMQEFQKWATEQGASVMEVNVCSENYKAKKLYQKYQFVTTQEQMTAKIEKG